MKRLVTAALAALLTVAVLPSPAWAATEISVTGTGSVTMPPDVANVSAVVETNAADVTGAMSANNARYDRIVTALLRAGIARHDIALSSYAVNYNPPPKVASANSGDQQYGYTVTRQFTVKVRRIGDAGKVVDTCTAAGATGIDGVSFGLSNAEAARARATVLAVADARAKAGALAAAAGLHVTSIKSLDLGGGPVVPMFRAAVNAAVVPTQFDQSNVTVDVSVNAVFLAAP